MSEAGGVFEKQSSGSGNALKKIVYFYKKRFLIPWRNSDPNCHFLTCLRRQLLIKVGYCGGNNCFLPNSFLNLRWVSPVDPLSVCNSHLST